MISSCSADTAMAVKLVKLMTTQLSPSHLISSTMPYSYSASSSVYSNGSNTADSIISTKAPSVNSPALTVFMVSSFIAILRVVRLLAAEFAGPGLFKQAAFKHGLLVFAGGRFPGPTCFRLAGDGVPGLFKLVGNFPGNLVNHVTRGIVEVVNTPHGSLINVVKHGEFTLDPVPLPPFRVPLDDLGQGAPALQGNGFACHLAGSAARPHVLIVAVVVIFQGDYETLAPVPGAAPPLHIAGIVNVFKASGSFDVVVFKPVAMIPRGHCLFVVFDDFRRIDDCLEVDNSRGGFNRNHRVAIAELFSHCLLPVVLRCELTQSYHVIARSQAGFFGNRSQALAGRRRVSRASSMANSRSGDLPISQPCRRTAQWSSQQISSSLE